MVQDNERHRLIKNQSGWSVGVDIEDVAKFRTALRPSSRFVSRTFSESEIEYCMSKGEPAVHFAGTFAAKEALYKAVNRLSDDVVKLTDFQISHDKKGRPAVSYVGTEHEPGTLDMKVSLSHTSDYAVAVALVMPKDWLRSG